MLYYVITYYVTNKKGGKQMKLTEEKLQELMSKGGSFSVYMTREWRIQLEQEAARQCISVSALLKIMSDEYFSKSQDVTMSDEVLEELNKLKK